MEQEEGGQTELGPGWVLVLWHVPGHSAEASVVYLGPLPACPRLCLLPSELCLAISGLLKTQLLASSPGAALPEVLAPSFFVSQVPSSVPGHCASSVNI